LAPDFWSVGLASAASKAAFLIQRRPAPFHPMFEEPLQTFLTEMLRRAEASHQANRPGVLTKAGPTGPVPDLEEGWLGHLFLCHVLLTRKAPRIAGDASSTASRRPSPGRNLLWATKESQPEPWGNWCSDSA
jgi:hypothetical protein